MPLRPTPSNPTDKVSLWCTLKWIALDDFDASNEPLREAFNEELLDSEKNAAHMEAIKQLRSSLISGELQAFGRVGNHFTPNFNEWCEIPLDWWTSWQPVWKSSDIGPGHAGNPAYRDVVVRREDVLELWPPHTSAVAPPNSSLPYRTPYMDLIDSAVRELRITRKNQPPAKIIAEWVRHRRVGSSRVSKNLAEAMATMLRLPESQKGGFHKPDRTADDG